MLLYLCLCFENLTRWDKFKTSDVYKGDLLYTSNLVSKPKIESFGRPQTPCSGKDSSTPSSTRAINTCRVLIKALISLLLIRLSNDIGIQPGPFTVQKGLNLCHWNMQHLTDSKFEEIRALLTQSSGELHGLDILILSETFCTGKLPDTIYGIPGYQVYRRDRIGKSDGGLLVYVNNLIQVKRRLDLQDNDIETVWFETYPYKSKRSLFIGGVCRPPSSKAADDKKLGKKHRKCPPLRQRNDPLGDVNVDYLCTAKFQKHSFVKTLKTLNLTQLVQVITRPKSRTCLDHIWCTHPERIINLRVLNSGLSDHLPILSSRIYKRARQYKGEHTTITYRDMKSLDKERFIASLRKAPWDCAFVFFLGFFLIFFFFFFMYSCKLTLLV